MFLQSAVLVKVALLTLLGSLEMIFSILAKLLDVLNEISSSRIPTLVTHTSINK